MSVALLLIVLFSDRDQHRQRPLAGIT